MKMKKTKLIPFLMSSDKKENIYSNKIVIDSWNNIEKYKLIENSFFNILCF